MESTLTGSPSIPETHNAEAVETKDNEVHGARAFDDVRQGIAVLRMRINQLICPNRLPVAVDEQNLRRANTSLESTVANRGHTSNPVRRGIVKSNFDWKWSSTRAFRDEAHLPVLIDVSVSIV